MIAPRKTPPVDDPHASAMRRLASFFLPARSGEGEPLPSITPWRSWVMAGWITAMVLVYAAAVFRLIG